MLRKFPDSKCIQARSLYYLSRYQVRPEPMALSKKNEDQGLQLYHEHWAHAENNSSLDVKDFDNLIISYNR